jgi:hypothetical protein
MFENQHYKLNTILYFLVDYCQYLLHLWQNCDEIYVI